MNFGQAIEAVKEGKLIARKGWNGKEIFVFLRPADVLSRKFLIENIRSLPNLAKEYYKKQGLAPEGLVTFTSYLCMKSADDTIVNGWLASQVDMLAEDWETV